MLETIIPTCAPRPRSLSTVANDAAFAHDEPRLPANDWGIIGRSHALRTALRAVQQVAGADATVLVTGESGTGKELIANAVHKASSRRERAFVKVNCAAMPANLIESELFGHERGAFTGATLKREGRFALADGGTLFLDEIGDISTALQVKLLRVLQEKEYEPLGGTSTIKTDARIIASTNRTLSELVARGSFREDLFYRLNVIKIELPPLSGRREDIPLLVQNFIQKFNALKGKEIRGISDHALDLLMQYDFPGNIRELRNIVERAVLMCEPGGSILPEHLPDEIGASAVSEAAEDYPGGLHRSLRDAVEDYEAAFIERALKAMDWNQTRTAQELNISRRALINKIQKHRIQRVDL